MLVTTKVMLFLFVQFGTVPFSVLKYTEFKKEETYKTKKNVILIGVQQYQIMKE